jgi:dUTP pyrophosphatase
MYPSERRTMKTYMTEPVSTGFTLTDSLPKCGICQTVNEAFPGKMTCGNTCLVKIRPLADNFRMPYRATPDSAGYDLTATRKEYSTSYVRYWLGFAMELPPGWFAEIFPRSSISKTNLILANCVGIIDTDYRDELFADFRKTDDYAWPTIISYKVGDRVAQMVFRKKCDAEFKLSETLSETSRRGGHGSTGR